MTTMAPVSASSLSATLLAGFQQAQAQTVQAVQQITAPGAMAPVDSAEFSDAARAASIDSIAGGAIALTQAGVATKALVLVERAQKNEMQALLDMLA